MKIAHRYVMLHLITSMAAMALVLLVLGILFSMIAELHEIGRGQYHISQALIYVFLGLPAQIYQAFPFCCLLGACMGLFRLRSQQELLIFRLMGFSWFKLARTMSWVALPLGFLALLLGESWVPATQALAQNYKLKAQYGEQRLHTPLGLWIRDGAHFIHIQELYTGGVMLGVTLYQFDENFELRAAKHANKVRYDGNTWRAEEVSQSLLSEQGVTTDFHQVVDWPMDFGPETLEAAVEDPKDLSIRGLRHYVGYLEANGLDSRHYQLSMWRKILLPWLVVVLVLLAIPCVAGGHVRGALGWRMLGGVVVGVLFYIGSELLGHASLAYQFSPLLGALLPLLLANTCLLLLLCRMRWL